MKAICHKMSEQFALCLLCLIMVHPLCAIVQPEPADESIVNQNDVPKTIMQDLGLNRLYPLLFRTDEESKQLAEDELDFEQYRGRRIGSIKIVSLDVFTQPQIDSDLIKRAIELGNDLHPKTRRSAIRNLLFFTEGDTLQPAYLISNMHFLYNQGLFSEIRMELQELPNQEVGITIYVRERFFLQISGKYISREKYNIKIMDRNLFGTGNSLKSSWFVDPQNQHSLGWESSFTNNNLFGSFIQTELNWADLPGYRNLDLSLQRPFLYPLFRYYAGGDYSKTSISSPRDSLAVKKQEGGLWVAHSFDLFEFPRYSYAALSLNQTCYQKRPYSGIVEGMPWQESLFALGALAITSSSYDYLPRISSFLDNDYLPVGYLFELYGGYDFGEYKQRPFVGLHSAWALLPQKDQYLYLSGAVESYLRAGKSEQAVVSIEPMYISGTKRVGEILGRSFIRAKYVYGHKRLKTEALNLNSDPLYHGSSNLQGTELIFLSLEEDLSLPQSLLGFQLTTFGFVDMAIMKDRRDNLINKEYLFSEGMGVRLRNPSLIWDFIEFSFAVDQSSQSDTVYNVEVNLKRAFSLKDFAGKRPQVYPFE